MKELEPAQDGGCNIKLVESSALCQTVNACISVPFGSACSSCFLFSCSADRFGRLMNAQDCRAETSVLQLSVLWQDCTWYLGYVCSKPLPSMAIDTQWLPTECRFFFYVSCFGILCCSHQKPSRLHYRCIINSTQYKFKCHFNSFLNQGEYEYVFWLVNRLKDLQQSL